MSEALGQAVEAPIPGELTLEDVHEIRLLLRGDSVVDWHRLALTNAGEATRLLRLSGVDLDDAKDREYLDDLRRAAHRYTADTLGMRIDAHLAQEITPQELLMMASGHGRDQRQACTLLKVMHIIHHLEARELRTVLSIPDHELYALVEQSVAQVFDGLREVGVPVVEFSWSRKTRSSLVTKLLVKRETSATQVFDRLRFRVVVEGREDIIPTLHVMLHRLIPFNYVVPGQTVNTLVDLAPLQERILTGGDVLAIDHGARVTPPNEFSASEYQILNFVADLPVRVHELVRGTPYEGSPTRLVFVLAEFQLIDRSRAELNESGDASHAQYKRRQYQRVRERLLREARPRAESSPDLHIDPEPPHPPPPTGGSDESDDE